MTPEFMNYLQEQGWIQTSEMISQKPGTDWEIWWDTSNQLEIFRGRERVANAYVRNLDELIRELDKLDP